MNKISDTDGGKKTEKQVKTVANRRVPNNGSSCTSVSKTLAVGERFNYHK